LRKISALAAVAVITVSALSGCASNTQAAANTVNVPLTCDHFVTSSSLDGLSVSIPTTGKPKVSIKNSLDTNVVATKVLKEGNGLTFGGNQQVKFDYVAVNATTGKELQGSSWNGTDAASQMISKGVGTAGDFCHGLAGTREGSVVAVLLNAKESHNSQANAAAGIGKDDSILFIFHLLSVAYPRALGDAMPAQDGFPQVVTNATGVPGLVMQNWDKSAAPAEFTKEVLVQGHGALVKENEYVTVHYSGYIWDTSKSMFDSSWTKGTPATFQLKQGTLIPGFIDALKDERVGSQIVAILPPKSGYGATGAGSIPANSTLIFVIDILSKGK